MANSNTDDPVITRPGGPYVNPMAAPGALEAYNKSMAQTWSDIQNHTNGYESDDGGWFSSLFGKIMEPIMDNVIKYGPTVFAAAAGADALGMFGGAGAASSGGADALGASLGDVGASLGSMPINTAALGVDGAGFSGLGGAATGLGDIAAGVGAVGAGSAPAATGGLGSMVGVEGGAPAVVTVGAPAATGGSVLPAALGAGLGAGAILGSNPTQPINTGALQQPPPVAEGGTHIPDSSFPPLVVPPLATHPELGAVNPVADGATNIPPGGTPVVTPPGTTPPGGTPPAGIPGLGTIPDWLKGILPLLQGNVDRIKADQDSEWWKSQLDTLQGMYKPGTQEATLMEQQMNAKDAAAGRNSQYGVRAVDLASNLASKRAGIMTSAGYQNMANAYRNRSSQDLNGLFAGMNNSNTQNLLGSLGGSIAGLFAAQPAPVR